MHAEPGPVQKHDIHVITVFSFVAQYTKVAVSFYDPLSMEAEVMIAKLIGHASEQSTHRMSANWTYC